MPNDMTNAPVERKPLPKTFPAMLDAFKSEVARALPKHMNADRMARIALTAFRSTPKLAECDPKSVFAAVIQSSQLGLEVGLMGEAHLVPYNGTCQLIPGYQGLVKLARNSGLVEDIYAHEVRQHDKFEAVFGLSRTLTHQPLSENGFPAGDDKRGNITGFYAVAVFKDGSKTFVAMSKAEVDHIRDNSNGYKAAKKYKKATPWDDHYVEMGKKTAIRRLCKLMPKSPELAQALAMDTMAERGKAQNVSVDDAIDGVWAPAADDVDDEKAQTGEQQGQQQTAQLPVLDDAAFEKNLTAWAKQVKKGQTPDNIIAMVVTKNSLTKEQEAKIRALAATDPAALASEEDVKALLEDAAKASITDADIAKHLKIESLKGLTVDQLSRAAAFVNDPVGASK